MSRHWILPPAIAGQMSRLFWKGMTLWKADGVSASRKKSGGRWRRADANGNITVIRWNNSGWTISNRDRRWRGSPAPWPLIPVLSARWRKATESFLELIRRVKNSADVPNYILIVKDYIAQHRTRNISIAELASRVGVSHGYLVKKFKEIEGVTIKQYIIKEKLKAAANMIKYSDASFSEIAEYLNFSSQSHMGQYFYKEFGMTPKEYQKKYKVIEFS